MSPEKPEPFSRVTGIDPKFKGAFPGGPPLVPEQTARAILADTRGFAAEISRRLKEKRKALESTGVLEKSGE